MDIFESYRKKEATRKGNRRILHVRCNEELIREIDQFIGVGGKRSTFIRKTLIDKIFSGGKNE